MKLIPMGQASWDRALTLLPYGEAGVGKTPMLSELKGRVLGMLAEPGTLSVPNSKMMVAPIMDYKSVIDGFKWLFNSKEAQNFDIYFVDSISEVAEIILRETRRKNTNTQKAYLDMCNAVYDDILIPLRYMRGKVVILTAKAKETEIQVQEGPTIRTMTSFLPSFPGKDLWRRVPHLIDEVLFVHKMNYQGAYHNVIATSTVPQGFARSRSGRLAPIEPPDLNYILDKIKGKTQ